MEYDMVYRQMQDFFSGVNQNFSLMEDPVDMHVQMSYFESSYRVRDGVNEVDLLARKDELTDPEVAVEKKKALLVQMAGVASPEVYRVLEGYAKEPDKDLEGWAKMAVQENRMLLESHLLDSQPVFISTGLGGKGNKLRYFVVLFYKESDDLKPFQKKIVQDEISYALQKYDSELENLNFSSKYATMLVVVPLSSDIARMFRSAIEECNQFGDFLAPEFVVTNMKELSDAEINEAMTANYPITDDDFPSVD